MWIMILHIFPYTRDVFTQPSFPKCAKQEKLVFNTGLNRPKPQCNDQKVIIGSMQLVQ